MTVYSWTKVAVLLGIVPDSPRTRPSICMAVAGFIMLGWSAILSAQTFTFFPLPKASSRPVNMTVGADGALWFTELLEDPNTVSLHRIGRITTSGVTSDFAAFAVVAGNSNTITSNIAAGSDGALWYAGWRTGCSCPTTGIMIGRMTTTGAITEFKVPIASGVVSAITAGPDDALWFTTNQLDIGRITTAGVMTLFHYPLLPGHDLPYFTSITTGPDGALWFVESSNGGPPSFEPKIGRITTAGVITEFPLATDKKPLVISAGSDGALWFTQGGNGICCANSVGRITTAGVISQVPTGVLGSDPYFITAGPDGALWWTEFGGGQIGRNTTAGVVTKYLLPKGVLDDTQGIVTGPDGALWFAEFSGNRIGRLALPSAAVTVSLSGSGAGSVASNLAGIACPGNCTNPFFVGTALTLSAVAAGGSTFMGWLGACTGTGTCQATVAGATNVSATFAPSNIGTPTADVDGNAHYDALTDGLLMLRAFFGLTGVSLTSGAIGSGATLSDATNLLRHMNDIKPVFDVDGNGQVDALTDGLLLLRYLFGLRGPGLIAGAIGTGPTRTTSAQIETYIQSLMP